VSAPDWIEPLAVVLSTLGAREAVAAVINRRKDSAETDLMVARTEQAKAATAADAVQAISEALSEVRKIASDKTNDLADLRTEVAGQATIHARQLVDLQNAHSNEMRALQDQIAGLTRRQAQFEAALSAHGQWDLYAHSQLLLSDPNFPEPPPLAFPD
jgi:chromosome segregation ATPase